MRLLTSGLYVTNLVSAVLCERPVARWSRAAARRGVKPRRQVRSWALRTDGEVRGDVLVEARKERRHPPHTKMQPAPRSPKAIMMASTRGTSRTGGHLAYVAECADDADDLAGYVLGRVNERGSELPAPTSAASRTRPVDGHVTSLAVHAKHRRRGVARALMRRCTKIWRWRSTAPSCTSGVRMRKLCSSTRAGLRRRRRRAIVLPRRRGGLPRMQADVKARGGRRRGDLGLRRRRCSPRRSRSPSLVCGVNKQIGAHRPASSTVAAARELRLRERPGARSGERRRSCRPRARRGRRRHGSRSLSGVVVVVRVRLVDGKLPSSSSTSTACRWSGGGGSMAPVPFSARTCARSSRLGLDLYLMCPRGRNLLSSIRSHHDARR